MLGIQKICLAHLVRREGEKPKGGKTVSEAYDYSGSTYNFYKDIFERNSIDTRGMKLDSPFIMEKTTIMHFGMVRKWYMVTAMERSFKDLQNEST